MKYNASLGTNANIHMGTMQMMVLLSFYYAESNTLYLQHILCLTGKYIKLMFGKLIRDLELSAVCRKKCELVVLHTAFDVPLTGSVRLLEEIIKVIRT